MTLQDNTFTVGLIKKNGAFFYPYVAILIVTLVVLFSYNKETIHLYLNGINSPVMDVFFKYFTWLGDGIFAVAVSVIFFLFRFRYGLMLIFNVALSGLMVQIMKKLIFVNHIRPYRYFSDDIHLHLVEGVQMYKNNSFPSGHTTTAFVIFLGIALLSQNKWIKTTCLIIAILVGYSRVYLSQHFLMDITAGSVLGIFFALLGFYIFMRSNKQWLDKSIIKKY